MPTGRDNRRPRPGAKPVAKTTPPVRPEAGARPLSGRQQSHLQTQREHLAHLHAAHVSGRPERVLHRTVVSVHRPEAKPVNPAPGRATRPRYGAATAARQRERRRANRRKIDWLRVLLRGTTVVLCVEVVAALVFSPRLWVHSVSFTGNATVPTQQLMGRLALKPETNVLRALLGYKKMIAAIQAEPTVEKVTVRPKFPDGIAISITERTPLAAVKFDTDPGRWYTIDKHLVPFRSFDGMPEAHLPLVSVATDGSVVPTPGKVCPASGLPDVGACLAWAQEQGTNFPVEKVTIDNAGKLCLNRAGGITVLLGPGLELKEKLNTLSLLLAKRTDLRGSAPTDIASVNLYAYDAPALVLRDTGQAGPASGANQTP